MPGTLPDSALPEPVALESQTGSAWPSRRTTLDQIGTPVEDCCLPGHGIFHGICPQSDDGTALAAIESSNYDVPDLLEEIARLARADLQASEFYAEVLGRLTSMLSARGARAWLVDQDKLDPIYSSGVAAAHERGALADRFDHLRLLRHVSQRDQVLLIPPGGTVDRLGEANTSDQLLAICPIRDGDLALAMVELHLPADSTATEQESAHRLLTVISDLAAAFHRHDELRRLRTERTWWGRLDQFARSAHATLRPRDAAYNIANDGQQVIGCDRCTVFLAHGSRWRVAAISGQDSVNRRANVVRRLDALTKAVMATREPFYYTGDDQELPPQVEEALYAYLDESTTRSLCIVPLLPPQPVEEHGEQPGRRRPASEEPLGGLVIEQFTGELIDRPRVTAVARHSAVALQNAREHRNVFLLPVWAAIGRLRWLVRLRTLPKTLLTLLALVAVVAALFLVPADFELTAEGSLQPATQRQVFAPADGVVDTLHVHHGSEIRRGAPLAAMRSSDFDLQFAEIEGQIETTIKKLAALNAARTGVAEELTRAEVNRMAAEEEELSVWLASLRAQREIYLRRRDELTVNSPLNGEVITWDVETLLNARPVTRGQVLMTVADLTDAWELELHLPEGRAGHLRQAQLKLGDALPVSYILATEPERSLAGEVARVAHVTSLNDRQELGVRVVVTIDKQQVGELRTGAKVYGRIHCGQRPIGFVWFHDLIEFVQSRIVFPWF